MHTHTESAALRSRPDVVTAAIIDTAIGMAHSHGLDAANRYLSEHGIGLLMTLRVLGCAQHRRPLR
jgi:hypothetical protein